MKILVLNYEYPPIGGGGGRVAENLNNTYVKLGYKVFVITSKTSELPFIEVTNSIKIYRLPVFRRDKSTSKIYQMLIYLILAFPLMTYVLLKEKIKFIHIHFLLPTGLLGFVAKKIFKTKYIVTLHGGDVPSHHPDLTAKYFKYMKYFAIGIIKNSDKCIAVSESLYQLAIEDFKKQKNKIIWINNGILIHENSNIELFKPIHFIFIGRLSKEKNILPIIKILSESNYDYRFDILGDGKQKSELLQFLHYKKEERINLHGWIDSMEIVNYLQNAHFMIMNSKIEGLSMAALEAMSYGVPIISSDCEGMKKIIRNGKNGIIFKNEIEFKEILEMVFDSNFEFKYKEMRNDTFEIGKMKYNIEDSARKYIKLFKNAIK